MKLLVVDDSLVMRNAIARSAAADEVSEILQAGDGAEAVTLYERHQPEMVTMDLTMPHLDGLAAIAALRRLDDRASILVISALNSHRDALEAIRRGACGFLTKPFTEAEVSDAIRSLADHARRRRS